VKPEKPWLHGEEAAPQPPVNPHMSRTEQLLAAQVGLNPRRGRSLQELIDEKWQRSRLNQLGQPVQPIATGAPVTSPLDAAVSAVREAWQQPQLRGPLMTALGELDALDDTLEAHREARRQAAVTQELDALEAQKLQLLAELEHLKAGADDVREKLRQEIYRSEARALEATLKKTEAARAEQARYEQLAADARAAAQDARALVDRLTGEELEQKIRDVALTQRVLERLEQLKAEGPAADIPAPAQAVSLEACVDRVRRRFATEGWELSPMEAANLCVCLAVSPALLITGAPGSGKTTAARLLAEALGLADRAPALAPGCRPEARDDCLAALRRHGDAPALVLLDDANLAPGPDPLQGLCVALSPEWRVIATLQDSHSGHPVCAAAWDAGFAVRLTPPAELPWRPAPRADAAAEAPVSIAGLLEALPCAALPEAMEKRMEALRRDLAAAGATLSRRALNDAWRYASAMLAALGESADPDALLDLAVAQRLLPGLLASAPIGALTRLRPLLKGLPACTALLDQPLPVAL